MTTVTAQHSGSYWYRLRFGLVALVAAVALTITLVVVATSGSGSSTKPGITRTGTGQGGTPTLCVPHGGGKIC